MKQMKLVTWKEDDPEDLRNWSTTYRWCTFRPNWCYLACVLIDSHRHHRRVRHRCRASRICECSHHRRLWRHRSRVPCRRSGDRPDRLTDGRWVWYWSLGMVPTGKPFVLFIAVVMLNPNDRVSSTVVGSSGSSPVSSTLSSTSLVPSQRTWKRS